MRSLAAFVFLFLARRSLDAAQCDAFSGPPGTTECVKFSDYYRHQWATCITDAYIRQKGRHKHACSDKSRTHCWYRCMLEVRGKSSGPVTEDCYYNPPALTTVSPTLSPATTLSPACYSPSGGDCEWFSDCLERKYPCKSSSTAYAVRYAKIFCAIYEAHAKEYSSQGRNWMNATRKCLQVSLVPLLRPWVKLTCQDIRRKALDSHSSCFLNPDQDVTSICALDCNEYFKIFWTIGESFFRGLDTGWSSTRAMWDIGLDCGANSIGKCFEEGIQGPIRISKIVVSKMKKNSGLFPDGDARNRLVNKLGRSIVYGLNLNTKFISWLAYPSGGSSLDSESMDVVLVLADKKALGIIHAVLLKVNFVYIFNKFASSIKRGTLPLTIDGTSYWVKSLALCSDKACIKTEPLAFSERPKHDDKSVGMITLKSAWMHGVTALVIILNQLMPFVLDN